MSDEIRRNMALFSMSSVMMLTDLTARQIRYYEQHGLISPARNSGNQRLFSFNDVERLLEVKSLIEKGVNIAGIKQVLSQEQHESKGAALLDRKIEEKKKELSDEQLHKLLKQQLSIGGQKGQVSLIQGDLSRFYKN